MSSLKSRAGLPKSEGDSRSELEITGVFDIETEAWDKFVLGALLLADGEFAVYDHKHEDELVDAILAVEGTLWAHNGGRYDVLWFLEHARRRGLTCEVFATSARVTLVKCGTLSIRDSAAIIPLSLADAARLAGREKSSTGLPCTCVRPCGGYCSIRRSMPRPLRRALTEYLETDCRVLIETLQTLQDYASSWDLDLKGTIGASAWATAKRQLGLPNANWGKTGRVYRFAREGYYGGRTQVFRPDAPAGYRYDINSAYPAALSRTKLPIGEWSTLDNAQDAQKAYLAGAPGLYRAQVTVREDEFIPPLPVRTSTRVAYPVGTFVGVWTDLELAEAEASGIVIERFNRAVTWSDAGLALKPFVDRIWDLRHRAGKSTPMGKWLKLYANSLTGKLAQRPETEQVMLSPIDPKACPADGICLGILCGRMCCKHACSRKCGRWDNLDADGTLWTRPLWRIGQCAHVHWAAYLTAATRIELRRQLVADGQDGLSAVYCDTDSVYATEARFNNIGPGLGEWMEEGTFRNFVALAPKTYRYEDPAKNTAAARSKGIPDAVGVWDDLVAHRPVALERGVKQLRTAARGESLFERRTMTRALAYDGFHYGDRVLQADGRTYPQKLDELES